MNITNARIVTPHGIIENGSVIIENGRIKEVTERRVDGLDTKGMFLLPGLVDLHGDDLEKEIFPRGKAFPIDLALHNTDLRMAASGITTKLHAIAFYENELKNRSMKVSRNILISLKKGHFLVKHLVHARCELTNEESVNEVNHLIEDELVKLVSVMVHAPGLKQFRDEKSFNEVYSSIFKFSESELKEIGTKKLESIPLIEERLKRIVGKALSHGIVVASHDDDCEDDVKRHFELGIRLSEFPVNIEAARKAKELGMFVSMGAPNVVRGTSHTGNLGALDALEKNAVDILCSDYYPSSMLASIFILGQNGIGIVQACNLVSLNPARFLGMDIEIGSIETGKRADIILVNCDSGFPRVIKTIVGGKEVLSLHE
ncbi:alpha-D-ribose 1-methylphosphonate 5-triphosphate diphosphatase [Patescibacteria group bacterium]|nr:alpha-D-ribose 1-methylphosphonate 5-triphosphate diphosphatase [Patescibacteria group bacterium]